LFIVVDLLLMAADTRITNAGEESVMRHFLTLALPPPTLPPGMVQPAAKGRLITLARCAHALPPCLLGTGLGTVALAVIATPTNALLALATGAIEYSIDDRTGSNLPQAGQLVPTTSLSPSGQALIDDRRELPEGSRSDVPRAFTFAEPALLTPLASRVHAGGEEEEPPQVDLRRRCFEARGRMANNSGGVTRSSPHSRAFRQPFTRCAGRCRSQCLPDDSGATYRDIIMGDQDLQRAGGESLGSDV
jgi:hypothetical protein